MIYIFPKDSIDFLEQTLKIVQQKIPEHIDKHIFLLYTTINRWLKPAQRETTYIIQDYK